jgi:NAD(P)-dependent dehydrogenase (short-subunit alcohol dehydrogenase family)
VPDKLVVLVTGSSSGIGFATAREAARRGHRVYASARQPDALAERLGSPNAQAIALDVTVPGAAAAAVSEILAKEGRLDVLVSNAGYGQYGAIEDVSTEQWHRQYEVNVFGAIESIRAALPPMRDARRGTIVIVSSVAGKLSIPFSAPYCSSKHALEAIADALRVEVAPFGIRVIVVEPGPIQSNFADRARQGVEEFLRRPGPYSVVYAGAKRAMDGDFQKSQLPPEVVAKIILDAAESRRPATRYAVTLMARLLIPLRRILPDRIVDFAFRRSLKLPRRV